MNDFSVILRDATVQDGEQILSIYRYYILNTAVTYEISVPALEEFKTRIENILKKYPYIVAEIDGKIAGYAYSNTFKPREAYRFSVENSIYVDHKLKQKGIGRLLLAELESRLKEQGIKNSYGLYCKATIRR